MCSPRGVLDKPVPRSISKSIQEGPSPIASYKPQDAKLPPYEEPMDGVIFEENLIFMGRSITADVALDMSLRHGDIDLTP